MDGSGEQPSLQTAAASEVKAKVEMANGSYACFICNHSARPQLKHALAAAHNAGADSMVDEVNLVLNCPMCTGEVYTRHAAAQTSARCVPPAARKLLSSGHPGTSLKRRAREVALRGRTLQPRTLAKNV